MISETSKWPVLGAARRRKCSFAFVRGNRRKNLASDLKGFVVKMRFFIRLWQRESKFSSFAEFQCVMPSACGKCMPVDLTFKLAGASSWRGCCFRRSIDVARAVTAAPGRPVQRLVRRPSANRDFEDRLCASGAKTVPTTIQPHCQQPIPRSLDTPTPISQGGYHDRSLLIEIGR